MDARRLLIFAVGADISDMWIGQRDDLPTIGRIGQNFLLAGDGGIEYHLADTDAFGADTIAAEHRTVGQCKNCRHERRQDNPWSRCDKRDGLASIPPG